MLSRRGPKLRLIDERPTYRNTLVLRGPAHLEVAFT
jgi:hypothetical protein